MNRDPAAATTTLARHEGTVATASRYVRTLVIVGVTGFAIAAALGFALHDSVRAPAVDRWFQDRTAGLTGQPGQPGFHYRVFWLLTRTENLGDTPLVIGVALFAAAVLALAARGVGDRLLWATVPLVALLLAGGVVEWVVKTLVNRHTLTNPAALYPSAHGAGTGAIAASVLFAFLRPDLRGGLPVWARRSSVVLFALLSVAVGLCMAILGGHYLTDVIGGWLLGAAVAAVVCLVVVLVRPVTATGDERR